MSNILESRTLLFNQTLKNLYPHPSVGFKLKTTLLACFPPVPV